MSQMTTNQPIRTSAWGRLSENQTAIDFIGRRKVGIIISSVVIVATVISLFVQGLNLGIDFEGGISWDVPTANGFTTEDASRLLTEQGIPVDGARIQERVSEEGNIVKIQVADQPEEVAATLRVAFASEAQVAPDEVNVNLVSSTWGSAITDKAVRALLIFILIVAIFISLRFEWRMAIGAIVAMIHDVLVSVGIYSIFQFIVTPPTVIAFLTILGYSLYDTIVVFDRVKENESRYAGKEPPFDDVVNVSMNQVLMRSLTTSFSSIVPVISLLLIGAGVLGQGTLAEFALALLVGMVTGAYSSILVASPLLAWLRNRKHRLNPHRKERATGEELRRMVIAGSISRRSRHTPQAATETGGVPLPQASGLSHPPRPRKKKKR
ncbi:MAG: protein translocase subunit SecF [Ilumatobacter coccineus]|uniref:Protein-export membrane protein SecF n=1 Tax=Ilumatobacter coccineus TaxID=467094 RepID=A0A2G6K817_9ACTN|nr:MAG: protein translocase subunit SecF [Ilumatobacter coccineus]